MLKLKLSGIIIIVGYCGSGKTEVSINLALDHAIMGYEVKIADLDLVNPYFRIREVKNLMSEYGVDIILPPEKFFYADLPILTPAVSGIIKKPSDLVILDVGGGSIGSTVLGTLSSFIEEKDVHMLYIVNPKRPYTNTIEGSLGVAKEIEESAGIGITGVVGNANMMLDTTIDDIYYGYDFALRVSKLLSVPLFGVTIPENILSYLQYGRINCPTLIIKRQLVPPWKF